MGQPWVDRHNVSVDMELNTLYCTNAECRTPIADLHGKSHIWKHVAYINVLIVKVSEILSLYDIYPVRLKRNVFHLKKTTFLELPS